MSRAIACISFIVAASFTVARAEPIIVLNSEHSGNFAQGACSSILLAAQNVGALDAETQAALTDCKLVPNTRGLGRRLEYDVTSKFAVNTRCKGITVLRMGDRQYDGRNDDVIMLSASKPHWDLLLDYHPGSNVHWWSLFWVPSLGNPMKSVGGEGTPAQIADEICIVVAGQSANIPQ